MKVAGSNPAPPAIMAGSSGVRASVLEVVGSSPAPCICQSSLIYKSADGIFRNDGGESPSFGTISVYSLNGRVADLMSRKVVGSIPTRRTKNIVQDAVHREVWSACPVKTTLTLWPLMLACEFFQALEEIVKVWTNFSADSSDVQSASRKLEVGGSNPSPRTPNGTFLVPFFI